jgi:aspartate carbamoyltransferase catalytic subunit
VLDDLDAGIRDADVVMALRIQRERIGNLDGIPGIDEYFARYGVSEERMMRAKPDAIVMHPGPMNRGIEIESSLADSARSVITRAGQERRRRAHGRARARQPNAARRVNQRQ